MNTKTFKVKMAEHVAEITRLKYTYAPIASDVLRVLEDVITTMNGAFHNRDYQYLASLQSSFRTLGVACFTLIKKDDRAARLFLEHLQLESEPFIGFVRDTYPDLEQPKGDELLGLMVENLIAHETYYASARPRLIEDLLEPLLVNAKTAEPVIRLCDAMAKVNNKEVCGASHVIKSLYSVADSVKTPIINAVVNWAKSQDFEIATSLKEGYPNEWVIGRCAGYAATLGLPLTGANLAIRSDGFVFQDMVENFEMHEVHSDEKHISYIVNKAQPDFLSVAGIIAFSLTYADLNPENLDQFNPRELLAQAAAEITEAGLEVNPELAATVLPRLVELMPAKTDVSALENTALAPFLRKIRKYNGFRLEDALGL